MSFQIIRNDITKVAADAIVNTANPRPKFVSGTDYAIYMAAGAEELLKERQKIGDIETGQAVATPAFALNVRYIIHTVGPVWIDGENGEREAVRSCYVNSLKLAKELGCESIAFPLIATGVYGFPKADALRIAVSVFSEFLAENDMQIILVVFDEASFVLSGKIFSGVDAFIDENYVYDKLETEYIEGPAIARAYRKNLFEGSHSESRSHGMFTRVGNISKPSFPKFKNKNLAKDSLDDDAIYDEEENSEEPVMEASMAMAGTVSAKPRTLDELMSNVGESWQESLFRLIDEKGYTDTEVYKRANVDRKLFSKIRSNPDYQPKKITAVAFALALKLSLDETKDLLGRAGYALSPSSRFDLIIEYFIAQQVYDTYTINLALFEHNQPLLGA
ncbi:MAG: macro domain-containing protein [Lachnospiraceae bacterium]|nr:macro domain-containing protein [Lachnospiraceae bacterium]